MHQQPVSHWAQRQLHQHGHSGLASSQGKQRTLCRLGTTARIGIRRLVDLCNARCLFLAARNLRLPSLRAGCAWLFSPLLTKCLLGLLPLLLLKLFLLRRQQRLLKPLLHLRLCIALLLHLLGLLSRDASAQLAVAAGVHVVLDSIAQVLRRWWGQG